MKTLLALLFLLGAGYYGYQNGGFFNLRFQAVAPVIEPLKPAFTHDFEAVSDKLQQDMHGIPETLLGEAPRPVHAFDVKRRVRPHLQEHPEYQTLNRVCDLIIQADAERGALQQSSHAEQSRTTFHSVLDAVDPKRGATVTTHASNEQAAIRQRMEALWGTSRTRTAVEVDQLLDSLKGKTL